MAILACAEANSRFGRYSASLDDSIASIQVISEKMGKLHLELV